MRSQREIASGAPQPTKGLISRIQRFCTHDGPGIRTTVFFLGCPLTCPWCHNPEGLSQRIQPITNESLCASCGACAAACPRGSGGFAGPASAMAILANPDCTSCGDCVAACPTGARQMIGWAASPEAIRSAVLADRIFFDDSGGGVTFSGGEPLAQAPFLVACLAACQREGVHTAVDTSGFCSREDLLEVATHTDLFLFDVKVLDPREHLRHVGVPLEPILANLEALDARGAAIWLRIPIVPGYTDGAANLEAVRHLALTLRSVSRICLLPYHRIGLGKYHRLGRIYRLSDVEAPEAGRIRQLASAFEASGLDVVIGG